MSSWFDKLLEELQRRQAEADARREGRPFPREERDVTPIDEAARRESRRNNGGDDGGGRGIPPIADSQVPWRRWLTIGGVFVVILLVLGVLGGAVTLITDVMWYDALGRRDVFATRLWAQVALFVAGFTAMLVLALGSMWLARRISPQAPAPSARRNRASRRVPRDRHRAGSRGRAAGPRVGCRLER